jgi:transcriptional regulator with XRE-family HTH domain
MAKNNCGGYFYRRSLIMHIGRNISKIRELLGIKQETLAFNLKISQQTISKIEQIAHLRDNTIDRIANALGVKANLILNYDEKTLLDFIKGEITMDSPTSCPLIENPNLLLKVIELYERLILSEKEKFQMFLLCIRIS